MTLCTDVIRTPSHAPNTPCRQNEFVYYMNSLSISDFLQETCACSDSELPENSCDPFTLPPVPEGAGHVALSREPEFYRQFFCQFIIEAPPHKTLQLFINNISIPETLKCKAGILRVYDGIPAAGGWELTREYDVTQFDQSVVSN